MKFGNIVGEMFFIDALVVGLITIGELKVLFGELPPLETLPSTLDTPNII